MGGGYGEGEAEGRRFAVLLCAEDSEYVKKVHGGYFKVFVSLLGEEGETWHVYRAARGELPPAEDVDAYDGFVISGSCSDAHGDDQWIRDLLSLLEALVSKKKQLLGVCFGHQVLLIDDSRCRMLVQRHGFGARRVFDPFSRGMPEM